MENKDFITKSGNISKIKLARKLQRFLIENGLKNNSQHDEVAEKSKEFFEISGFTDISFTINPDWIHFKVTFNKIKLKFYIVQLSLCKENFDFGGFIPYSYFD